MKALTDRIKSLESGGSRGGNNKKAGGESSPSNGKWHTSRKWENDNYCWTCGYDIKHTSLTCLYIKDTEKHRTKQQQIP